MMPGRSALNGGLRRGSSLRQNRNNATPNHFVFPSGTTNSAIEAHHARMIGDMSDLYMKEYIPQENLLVDQLNDRSVIADAKDNADQSFTAAQGRSKRNQQRYGLRLSAAQREAADNATELSETTNYVNQVNNAHTDQYDKNIGLRNSLINIGRGMQSDAVKQFGNQATAATDRSNAYDTARTNASNARRGQTTQLAGTALMAAAMFM